MYLLGLKLAELRGTLEPRRARSGLIAELKRDPAPDRRRCVEQCDEQMRAIAEPLEGRELLPLPRPSRRPAGRLEGALKLKEISYIPTDAYAAGEMKHGPIALLDESTPVVCVATDIAGAREGALEHRRGEGARRRGDRRRDRGRRPRRRARRGDVFIPRTDWMLQPILAVIPLQLLAYHIARLRGLNVDQPRNLAKTVTVE